MKKNHDNNNINMNENHSENKMNDSLDQMEIEEEESNNQ